MNNIYAVVVNGVCVDIVMWDGVSQWEPKEGEAVPANDNVGIGWLWDGNEFTPPKTQEPMNEEKRKAALSELSTNYQSDITKLNISWLAAAVSDGVNEIVKKDAVISQINDRKTQYATDRAAIIAQYPED